MCLQVADLYWTVVQVRVPGVAQSPGQAGGLAL